MKRVFVDLSDTEEAEWGGWVNKGLNDPTFANYPWRLVLHERTRARFDQIAAQFASTPPVIVPPPSTLPYEMMPEIFYGDFGRKIFASSSIIVSAFPFRTPVGPFNGPNGPLLQMSAAENPSIGGSPWLRRLAISETAGDMVGLLPQCIGKEAMLSARVGIDIPEGRQLYANTIIVEDAPPGTTGTGFSINWPMK